MCSKPGMSGSGSLTAPGPLLCGVMSGLFLSCFLIYSTACNYLGFLGFFLNVFGFSLAYQLPDTGFGDLAAGLCFLGSRIGSGIFPPTNSVNRFYSYG